MNALAYFFEDEGVAATGVSLVREHTLGMRPPRLLWVPFEFGRPLGAPNDPDFQRRVIVTALQLLEAERGPILADFPDDAPQSWRGGTKRRGVRDLDAAHGTGGDA